MQKARDFEDFLPIVREETFQTYEVSDPNPYAEKIDEKKIV